MLSEYQIVFEPKGSRDSQVIREKSDSLLSTIRDDDDSLNLYFFLTKDRKFIQKKYESKYTISEVLVEGKKIIMSKKDDKKDPENKNEDPTKQNGDSQEIILVFEDEKREDLIKVKPSTTLEEIQKQNVQLQNYYFLNKSKKPIKSSYNKNYTVKEIEEGKKIFLKKKEDTGQKQQASSFFVQFKNSSQKRLQIKASPSDTLSNLRKNSELQGYVFLSKNGQILSMDSQKKTKVEEVVVKNIIYMKQKISQQDYKTQTQAKKQKIQEEQEKRIKSLGELMKNVKELKGNINKQGNKQRMNEISKKLKEQGMNLEPQKLTGEHELNSVIETLKGKQTACQNIIEYAKKIQDRSEAESFAANGLILPTIYNTKKKQTETLNIVDFAKTKKIDLEKQKRSYKLSVIQYQATQDSTVSVDLSKSSQYEFNGGSLNVSAYGFSSKVESGKAELHENQKVTTKKGVKKNEKVNHLYLAFAINRAVYFHKDDIFLKAEVVKKFEQIVTQFRDFNDSNLLEEKLNKFIDKYGIGISSSLYYLGGIYNNTINYTFYTETSSEDLTTIVRNESQFSLGVAVGGSYGPFSAEAGYEHNTKSTDQKGWTNKKTNKKTSYKTVYFHQAAPLSSIQDINLWRETIEAFPNNWVVVGFKDNMEISLIQLLRSQNNSVNMNPEFLVVKEKVLQKMENTIKSVAFNFDIEPNPKFLLTKNQIKKAGEPHKQYQILGKIPFPDQKTSFYTVEIVNSQQMEICIGICCLSCKVNEYSRPKNNEVIYYRLAGKGKIETKNEEIKVGIIVKKGNKVRVVVDTTAFSTISWFVEGKFAGKVPIPVQMLQKGIYPYFQMFTNNDVIRVI